MPQLHDLIAMHPVNSCLKKTKSVTLSFHCLHKQRHVVNIHTAFLSGRWNQHKLKVLSSSFELKLNKILKNRGYFLKTSRDTT